MNGKFPIQPIEETDGVHRFVKNRIVSFLLDNGPHDMNSLAKMDFTSEEREQFAMLIGYSLSGFGELPYTSDETYDAVWKMAKGGITETDARNHALRLQLREARSGVGVAASVLFGMHPDDFDCSD